MKLSEAIVLGSTIVKPFAGDLGKPGGPGCAMGMALEAVGLPRDYDDVFLEWPWTGNRCLRLPCNCLRKWLLEYELLGAVCHLFDHHVTRRGDWTLERLADWVASVEPPEQKARPSSVGASLPRGARVAKKADSPLRSRRGSAHAAGRV